MKYLITLSLLVILISCSTIGNRHDSAPKDKPDMSQIPDAVPRDEPKSKYGNPAHYEVLGKRYYTLNSSYGYHEKGIASWYGTKFHGRRTSSGEIYDMYKMTAAHKTLPLPTYVEVTNVKNGRTVIVKVNDRGPFHGNRLIDLSYSAASKLGIISEGTGIVEIRAISPNARKQPQTIQTHYTDDSQSVGLYLQVGAFSNAIRAEELKKELQHQIGDAVLIMPLLRPEGSLYRVRIGPLANVEYGDSLANQLLSLGFHDAHIVVE